MVEYTLCVQYLLSTFKYPFSKSKKHSMKHILNVCVIMLLQFIIAVSGKFFVLKRNLPVSFTVVVVVVELNAGLIIAKSVGTNKHSR